MYEDRCSDSSGSGGLTSITSCNPENLFSPDLNQVSKELYQMIK